MDRISLASGAGPTFGVDDLACAAATYLGCWEEAGLDVSWTPARGGVKAMTKILDGEVDAAYGGLGPVLQLRANGAPLRIVASMARALAQNLVVRPNIRIPADLAGARWSVDGIGALSHHMARSIVATLPFGEGDVIWQVDGPPPERIAALLSGRADASLIRVEEALSLARDPSNDLRLLLGFADLKKLVPLQPHGVLATTEAYEAANPRILDKLATGIIDASRRLRGDFDAFLRTYEHYVSVSLPPSEIERIWQQECASEGFAVNGEVTDAHWDGQLVAFARLNPRLRTIGREEVLSPAHVLAALARLGTHPGPDAP